MHTKKKKVGNEFERWQVYWPQNHINILYLRREYCNPNSMYILHPCTSYIRVHHRTVWVGRGPWRWSKSNPPIHHGQGDFQGIWILPELHCTRACAGRIPGCPVARPLAMTSQPNLGPASSLWAWCGSHWTHCWPWWLSLDLLYIQFH